jgi:hypothetical protein
MTIIRTQAQIADATMGDLVETYNALAGKTIKKFESRAIAENKVSNAILAAQDAAGHLGVPKDTKPQAKTVKELADIAAHKGITTSKDEATMATTATAAAPAAKKTAPAKKGAKAAPAKKGAAAKKAAPPAKKGTKAAPPVAAKKGTKAAPAKAGRHNTYTHVRIAEPTTPRRPQEGSQRNKVLQALRSRKDTTIDQLSTDCGFDVRTCTSSCRWAGPRSGPQRRDHRWGRLGRVDRRPCLP